MNRVPQIAYKRGYRVADDGTVMNGDGRILSGSISSGGYRKFRFDGALPGCLVHRLVAFQKFGEAIFREGVVARHLDGNPLNNRVENIALGSHDFNMRDKSPAVTMASALKATAAHRKYDAREVIAFYKASGRSYKATMAKFGITSKGTLNFILRRSMEAKMEAAA